jgi:hypothetical protein
MRTTHAWGVYEDVADVGRFVETFMILMERHGDAKLPELLQTLTNCPKAHSANIHDRCKAVYSGLRFSSPAPPPTPQPT